MVQRVQVVALAISVAIGAAVVAGLTVGSQDTTIHVGPTTLPALELVDVYATVLVKLAGPAPAGAPSPRTIRVSRAIYDTCLPRADKATPCGHTKVSRLKPDIEAALYATLAGQGFQAVFGDDGDLSLHQVVTEPTGTPAVDGDDGRTATKFHFKPVGGRLQLQGTSVEWTAGPH